MIEALNLMSLLALYIPCGLSFISILDLLHHLISLTISSLFCNDVFETFPNLSAVLLSIKLSLASAVL